MKKNPFVYFILSLAIAFGACDDPVFYIISVEPPIAKPYIGGSPTNFIVFENKMYVASGRNVYSYDGANWSLIDQPGGIILQLAATDSYLYALCYGGSGNNLKRMSSSLQNWEDVTGDTAGYDRFQSVYAAKDKVFIGAEKDNAFIILYIDEALDLSFKPLTPEGTNEEPIAMLCGLASDSDNYYLCTRGGVIFVAPQNAPAPETISKKNIDARFTGIINLGINDRIVAISRDGSLYYIDPDADPGITKVPNVSFGDRSSTGALAVWQDETGTLGDTPKLLLAGRQDRLDYSYNSGYTYGYLELELDAAGIKEGGNFVEPGKGSLSSAADYERYVSTIGKYPVNHIFQTPAEIDPNMTLFASTQKNGVWSYRPRGSDDTPQWNAED